MDPASTSSNGGVALQSMDNHYSLEKKSTRSTKSMKSDESTSLSSRSDQIRSQSDHSAGISDGVAAPNYYPNDLDPNAHDPEAPPLRYLASPVAEPPRPLRWWDVSSLIINKMIGTGIYTSPPAVLVLTGNKREALGLWVTGFAYTLVR